MISSTCFGQTFAHLQERKTEVFHNMCSCSFLHTVHIVPRRRAPNPCLPQQQDIIPHVVKNLSLALLKMGKSLPETCWADHWRSIKRLLLHLIGFYFTLPTLMMHGQTQIKSGKQTLSPYNDHYKTCWNSVKHMNRELYIKKKNIIK